MFMMDTSPLLGSILFLACGSQETMKWPNVCRNTSRLCLLF